MDIITDREKDFPLPELLDLEYFKKYRRWYYRQLELGKHLGHRNYINLLEYIAEVYSYKPEHARAFAKAFREDDWRKSESSFAELIVYRYYIRLVYENLIKSINLDHQECDTILERLDGSKAFLEVFSIGLLNVTSGEAYDIKTHTQDAMASVRQKLLNKIKRQRQMAQPRENYAVIEANDISIAANVDFAILSSLSSGYKIWIDKKTMKKIDEGYDWKGSVFEDESTKYLKGVIYFALGDYESRECIINPNFVQGYDRTMLCPACG